MPHARRILSSSLSLALALACNPQAASTGKPEVGPDPAAGPGPAGPAIPAVTDPVAELTALSGPSGARTDDLPEGTFLGPGAKLGAGKTLVVPRGTIAEVRLAGGTVLRLNEDTRLTLPDGPDARALALAQGEVVAIVAAGQPPLGLKVGPDTLDISSGEARALARGERRGYDVVYGSARLRTGGQDVPMGPGAHVDTPLAAPAQPVQPQVSLRPLEDTAWSRTFEIAAQMADSVPAGVGSLTARRAGSQTELYKLALVDQKVNVAISGRIARTEIEQTFYNEAGEVLEGTYRFPLPADASISGLQLLVGNTWMNAEMLEKQRAREIFKQIVDATIPRDPALLEWERGNIFKLKIFPIPGRGERKIRLSYTQILPAVGDTLRYRYAMSGASTGATGTEIENFQFTIAVDKSELPATGELVTPMAALQRRETGDRVELTTAAQRFRPVHDLGVDIPIPAADQRVHAETHLDRDGQAYFMLAFRPQIELKAADRPRHYAFVLDRSHSTTPELWTVARSLVQATAATLQAGDRMTVLACDAACDAAPGGLAPASDPAHLAGVERFLDGQVLAGASDIGGMMRSASEALAGADMADPRAREADRVIVYLGDGSPSAGALAPDELLRDLERPLSGVRVEAVALGARSDLLMLGALTKKTGGDLMRADAKDDLRGLVRELRLRAALPVARDVALTLPDGMVYTHPDKIASIRPGDTITLVGKLSRPVHGPLTLRATGPDGQVVQDSLQVDLEAAPGPQAARRAHLPRTWAREEIESLTANRGNSARAEIIDLSRQYTVLSRYTALLVLENDAMYREFNVVRQSGRTTGWNGQLGGNTQPTGAPLAGAAPATTTLPRADNKDAAAAEAAPTPRPTDAPAPDPRAGDFKSGTKTTTASDKSEADDSLVESESRASREQQQQNRGPAADSASEAAEEEAPINLEPASDEDRNASAEKAKTKSAPPAPRAEPAKKADMSDPFGDDIGGGGGSSRGGLARPGKGYRPPRHVWKIGAGGAPDGAALAKLDTLRRAVLTDPTSRAAHRRLVQAAIRAGAADAFEHARGWAEADPDHAPALLAVADLLAARSDPNASRAYGSAAEVKPFDKQLQARLADAYENKGDLARACAHRRAVVSIDPARAPARVDLARCLSAQGKNDVAREILLAATSRAPELGRALRDLDAGLLRPLAPTLPSSAELRATLTYSGAGDLDIALVDARGRRLSALRPDGIKVVESVGGESLTYASVRSTLAIEVSRIAGQGSMSGTLTLRTPSVTKSFPFTIDQGSLRLATVSHTVEYGGYHPYYYDDFGL